MLQDRDNEQAVMPPVRILFVADTHLGFDWPFKPRIKRRRRGPDFFANFRQALEPALQGEVDFVVHGGDLLFRSKVPARLVEMAFEPIKQVADRGIPFYLVPGNHERSAIPYRILTEYPNIHIFHKPRTFSLHVNGLHLTLTGFPYVRDGIRQKFLQVLEETGYKEKKADVYLLCMHHCVEGASVGPHNFTFRDQDFVVRMADIPRDFSAVLSGHIHRFQVVTKDLWGRPAAVPVLYPGSIDRTSFAEKDEKKGFLAIDVVSSGPGRGKLEGWAFHELPTRTMVELPFPVEGLQEAELKSRLKEAVMRLPRDSIVKLRIRGEIGKDAAAVLSAASLRSLCPSTMNVDLSVRA